MAEIGSMETRVPKEKYDFILGALKTKKSRGLIIWARNWCFVLASVHVHSGVWGSRWSLGREGVGEGH